MLGRTSAGKGEYLMAIEEKSKKLGWDLKWAREERGADHEKVFTSSLFIFGREIAREEDRKLQDAKDRAARSACQTFKEEEASEFGDRIAALVQHKWLDMVRAGTQSNISKTVIAGIVQEDTVGCSLEVVALGAGTAHKLSSEDGRQPWEHLNDCHAEILARRALLKHFFQQIACTQRGERSIFRKSAKTLQAYQLSDQIRFHLYVSIPPCGDAACCMGRADEGIRPLLQVASLSGEGPLLPKAADIAHSVHWPSQMRNTHGKLRAKRRAGESLSLLPNGEPDSDVCKMSCSDKILRWNACGLQGAALSHLIDPVYLHSITIGDNKGYSHTDFTRALCCRLALQSDTANTTQLALVPPYRVNHPEMHRSGLSVPGIDLATPAHGDKCTSSNIAACWAMGDASLEWIFEAKQGLVLQRAPRATLDADCNNKEGGSGSNNHNNSTSSSTNLRRLWMLAHKTPVSKLFEFAQKMKCGMPVFTPFALPPGQSDLFGFTAHLNGRQGIGAARSKKEARQAAAAALLPLVRQDPQPSTTQARLFELFCGVCAGAGLLVSCV